MTVWTPRRRVLVGAALLGLVLVTLVAWREPFLRSLGWVLVSDEPVGPADAIVIAIDADGAGVLEAADLVHSGISPHVAVFADPPDAVDREFVRRGVAYEDRAARQIRQLRAFGVAIIEQIPLSVGGTEDEGLVLPDWCDRHDLRFVVVVSSADHPRRLRRVLRRAMKGRRTTVTVRRARYSQFDPERWWQTRAGIRTGIVELEKLILDVVRHPFS